MTSNNIHRFIGNLIDYCDFFVHTWNVRSETSSDLILANTIIIESPDLFQKWKVLYNPKVFVVEDYYEYLSNTTILKRIEPLFYSLRKSNEYRNEYSEKTNTQYDFVVKLRPDSLFNPNHKLIDEINSILKSDFKNTIYTLDWGDVSKFNKFEDCIWIAHPHIFDIAVDFWKKRAEINIGDWQTQMGDYLIAKNIKFQKFFHYNDFAPYRWSDYYNGITLENFESKWDKIKYGLI